MANDLSDDIEAIGHRKAWRYRHEKHEHESNSIYEFRRFTLIDFARAAIAADRALNAPAQAPAESRCDGCGKTVRDHDSMMRCHPARVAPAGWSEADAVALAHRAGFAGTWWSMGPYELVHLLNIAAPQPAPEPQSADGPTVYSVTLDRHVKGPTV